MAVPCVLFVQTGCQHRRGRLPDSGVRHGRLYLDEGVQGMAYILVSFAPARLGVAEHQRKLHTGRPCLFLVPDVIVVPPPFRTPEPIGSRTYARAGIRHLRYTIALTIRCGDPVTRAGETWGAKHAARASEAPDRPWPRGDPTNYICRATRRPARTESCEVEQSSRRCDAIVSNCLAT